MPTDFLDSPRGYLTRYHALSRQRAYFDVKGIEPRAKDAMPEEDKVAFQRRILQGLRDQGRRGFRHKVALQLSLGTTSPKANPAHHLAKNLLDLLDQPLVQIRSRRHGLLYPDDQCVETLSVAARHGQETEFIRITAMAHWAFLEQLAIAADVESWLQEEYRWGQERNDMAVDEFGAMLRDAEREREIFGVEAYETLLDLARREAQERALGSGTPLRILAWLHGAPTAKLWARSAGRGSPMRHAAEDLLLKWPVRIALDELPQEDGGSKRFKALVRAGVQQFQETHDRLLQPLRVPVAMQVVVKPPPTLRRRGLHDLDNVVRKYLVGPLVEALRPPGDVVVALAPLAAVARDLGGEWQRRIERIPPSLRVGLTRYEVWRLPPPVREDDRGFVIVGLVADQAGIGGPFTRMDSLMMDYADTVR